MIQEEILIVNDGSLILKMMGLLLEGKGYQVNLTDSSEDGLAVLSTRNIGLVVLKLNGASHGRLALAPMVKDLDPRTRLVIVSGTEYLPAEFFEIEVDEYIIEPCRAAEMWRRLLFHLQKEDGAVMAPGDCNQLHPASRTMLHNLGLMFHDIRAQLTSISAGMKLVQRRINGRWDQEVEALFQETVNKTHTLRGVAEEFLQKFHKEDQLAQIRPWVDLGREVVDPVLAEMQDEFQRHRITLDNRICLLPSPKRTVRGHQATLKSIFRNILSNAVKYGGSGCAIAIDRDEDPAYFRLRVHNTGFPLSMACQDKVFNGEPAGRGDGQGMGLGLYLGREVMRSHGGDISCEPDPRGANFIITLPLT